MEPGEDDEDSVMLINDLKIKWFTLLSRVDASPTIDEMVLSSFNSIANLLITHRSPQGKYDLLFDVALKMGIFECIFRWNFVFSGSDLEAYKYKELQFYETLISGAGKYYLRHSEFALPLLATLHHCAIRSSLTVERVLIRTLNSVCAALCAHTYSLRNSPRDSPDGIDGCRDHPNHSSLDHSGIEMDGDDLLQFRRWCLGLIDAGGGGGGAGQKSPEPHMTPSPSHRVSECMDWTMTSDQQRSNYALLQTSLDSNGTGKSSPTIDSIFDLLVPFVFRENDLGWQARDAMLLVSTYSARDEELSYGVAHHSTVCPVLATGLATMYAELPRRLVSDNLPESWPLLMQKLEDQEETSSKYIEFFNALDFCQSILEVAHPLIQSSLLHYIHSGFFVSVLGFSLTQPCVEDVVTATVYLKQLIIHSTKSTLLPTLLRFLLTRMPEENHEMAFNPSHSYTSCSSSVNGRPTNSESRPASPISGLSVGDDNEVVYEEGTASPLSSLCDADGNPTHRTYMDLLISRLHYCNTLLGVATLSLFNTILSLNCEDIMFYLILRHLVPYRDRLFSIGWVWPEANTFVKAAGSFLKNIQTNEAQTPQTSACSQAHPTPSIANGSVAELNLDEDPDLNGIEGDWCGLPATGVNFSHTQIRSDSQGLTEVLPNGGNNEEKRGLSEVLMPPVHSELTTVGVRSSSVSNGYSSMNGKRADEHSSDLSLTYRDSIHLTPEDWLNYISWARGAITTRQIACSEWRLSFDSTRPEASQLSAVERSLLQATSAMVDPRLPAPEPTSSPSEADRLRPNLHSLFKCFTRPILPNNLVCNPTSQKSQSQLKQQDGERTAAAVHLAVRNLDIHTDLDMDFDPVEVRHSSSMEDRTGSSDQEDSGFCTAQPSDATPLSQVGVRKGADCRMRANSTQRRSKSPPVVLSSLPGSVSDQQVTSLDKKMDKLNVRNKVQSWYCLNYLENEFGVLSTDDGLQEHSPKPMEATKHSTGPSPIPTNSHSMPPHQSEKAVEEVLCSTEGGDLDEFIQCLDRLNSPEINSQDNHLEAYFDSNVENSGLVEVFNGSTNMVNESANFTDEASVPVEQKPSQCTSDEMNGTAVETEAVNLRRQTELTTVDVKTLPNCHRNPKLRDRCQSHDSTGDSVGSYSTQFLGTLLRRHSTASRSAHLLASPQISQSNGRASVDSMTIRIGSASLGPFLTTILARLESLPHNCFYANLYLTNMLSSLAAYGLPLLRAILLLVVQPECCLPPPGISESDARELMSDACDQLPHAALTVVRKQLDEFAARYAKTSVQKYENRTFLDLIADAKCYFRNSSDPAMNHLTTGGLVNGTCNIPIPGPKPRRPSFLRRMFRRSRRKESSTSLAVTQPAQAITQESNTIDKENFPKKSTDQSRFVWLPDTQPYNVIYNSKKQKSRRNNGTITKSSPSKENSKRSKRRNKSSTTATTIDSEEPIDWWTTRRMVLCAVVYEEFCKELASLCVEHSTQC